ncbi:MAG: hypothetical protein ABIG95_04335 [Candidatus Woesearchaeota archaeon]
MKRKEVKIFFSVLLVCTIFTGFAGWNESALMSLTLTMGLENGLQTDSYVDVPLLATIDRMYKEGHWYSFNAPGLPFFGQITAKILRLFFGSDFSADNINLMAVIYVIIVLTSGVSTACTAVLVYKICKFYVGKEWVCTTMSFAYSFGTIALLYGTRYRSHALATFLAFLCFYLIIKTRKTAQAKNWSIMLAGFAGGWAAIADNPSAVVALACLFLIAVTSGKNKLSKVCIYLIGLSVPFLVWLAYNYCLFGNPLSIGYFNIESPFFPNANNPATRFGLSPNLVSELVLIGKDLAIHHNIQNIHVLRDISAIEIRNIIQLLFLPYRGLFFYSPILLLALIGLPAMYRKHKYETILLIVATLIIVAFTASWPNWYCHGGGGCRRFLTITPFLILPLVFAVEKMGKGIFFPSWLFQLQ